jgi:predicted transcriptional regulator
MLEPMKAIKISSKVDEQVWNDLRAMADESHQSISGLLTDAIAEYLQRRRVRPVVLDHAQKSIAANEDLVRRLAE